MQNDLISRSALIDWINKQREAVTKKQVLGTDQSIFTREDLVAMQRCLNTFEIAINNQPTAYDVEKVVAELEERKEFLKDWLYEGELYIGQYRALKDAIEIVNGGAEQMKG